MKYLPSLLIICLVLYPELASAAGLVNCSGTTCSACNFIELGNRIVVWLIMIMFMIFAVIAVSAGWGLVTSGGNTSALQEAKGKFTNAFIGLIIVLAAFLLVDSIMKALLDGGTGTIKGYGPWSEVKCSYHAVPELVAQDSASTQIPTPNGIDCKDENSLINRFGGSPKGLVDPELTKLINCYMSDPAISAGVDSGQIYTVDRSNPICAATNGNPVCSSCSHSINSCHYGRGSGRGALGVDFNAKGITEEQLLNLIQARQSTCGGRTNFEGNHTHVSLNSC
ncbi:hypothetical protein KC926_03745 [Candidatus Kaiserbacteria bacterium]|nr:hypothetical protein [Candidatus Kaiserbacteria bacterium]